MIRRALAVVSALALAGVGTLLLVVYVRGAEARALAGEEVVSVLVVGKEIPRGTKGEDLSGLVGVEEVPKKVAAAGVVADVESLAGRVAAVTLLPGEQVVAARFIDPADLTAASIDIPEELQQVTVALDAHRALGGHVRPGDTVAVTASFASMTEEADDAGTPDAGAADDSADPDEGPATHTILRGVLVANVQGGVSSAPAATEDAPDATASPGTVLVTLATDPGSVERIVFAAEHGTVWLSADPASAPREGTQVQSKESIFR